MPQNPLLDFLNAIHRQIFLAVCALVVGATLTVWTVYSLPDVFRSTTLIMVEPQGVPEAFVKASVTTRVEQRLNALSQEVLSRTRLEAIIQDLDLFRAMRDKGVAREQVVDAMRGRIQISVFAQDNAFRISYEDSDRSVAQQVTARLAGLYIDENLKMREQSVTGTTEFLENELEKVKQQLEKQEGDIQGFKQQHMGELPEQRDANTRALEGLRVQLQTVTLALSSAQERKVLLERQAREMQSMLAESGRQNSAAAQSPRAQLEQAKAELEAMRGRYTEEHPDVVRLRNRVRELLKSQDQDTGDLAHDPRVPPEMARALAETDIDIRRMKAGKEDLEKAIETYQARIEAAFTREQQLQVLVRDYDVTRKNYQTLLDKKLDAQLSQSLERRQKGERFRVLDPASMPERPARPNRQALVLAGLGLSLAVALGLPLLLWQLDSSLHGPAEVAQAFALPVLATVPLVHTPALSRQVWRRHLRIASLSLVALIVGLGGVTVYAKYLF
jgi:polysaccharide chain length determinant protein (PEP-CTERM system associated)